MGVGWAFPTLYAIHRARPPRSSTAFLFASARRRATARRVHSSNTDTLWAGRRNGCGPNRSMVAFTRAIQIEMTMRVDCGNSAKHGRRAAKPTSLELAREPNQRNPSGNRSTSRSVGGVVPTDRRATSAPRHIAYRRLSRPPIAALKNGEALPATLRRQRAFY